MRFYYLTFCVVACMCFFFGGIHTVLAENINTDSSGNTSAQLEYDSSTVNFDCTNCNVEVTDSAVTGAAWGETIGWITLNPTTEGVVNSSGTLSGFAWGDVAGWVNFSPTNGGVTIVDGKFSGTAWSENFGWIIFSCPGAGTSCVQTSWPESSSSEESEESVGSSSGSYSIFTRLITKNKEIQGCKDEDAFNFNASADIHNQTMCVYRDNFCDVQSSITLEVSPDTLRLSFRHNTSILSLVTGLVHEGGNTSSAVLSVLGPDIVNKQVGVQEIYVSHETSEGCLLVDKVTVTVLPRKSEPQDDDVVDTNEQNIFSRVVDIFTPKPQEDILSTDSAKTTNQSIESPEQNVTKPVIVRFFEVIESITQKVSRFFRNVLHKNSI